MKILVLGDSHTAAVKHGWDAIAQDHPDTHVDFFALPKERMLQLCAAGAHLALTDQAFKGDHHRLKTRFPQRFIDTASYDLVFLVGLIEAGQTLISANLRHRLPHQSTHQSTGQTTGQKRRFWQRVIASPADQTIVTRAMFEAAWDALYQGSVARHLLDQMAITQHPRCVLASNPMISEAVLTLGHPMRAAMNAALASKDATLFMDMARTRLQAALPATASLLVQPPKTVHKGCLSKSQYMTGAVTFYNKDKTFGRTDTLHANETYGIALWQALLAQPSSEAPIG